MCYKHVSMCTFKTYKQIFFNMWLNMKRHNSQTTNLLTELLQVGDHTVAQAVLHVVSQQVWCSHDSQSFPQRLQKEHRNKTSMVSFMVLVCYSKEIKLKELNSDSKSTDPNIIWRHCLQVVLKGLSPFDGWLEFVHFDQVICKKKAK